MLRLGQLHGSDLGVGVSLQEYYSTPYLDQLAQ
jgi:hypothetical protein